MRILMLGNSFISTNNMPQMLSELTGAEVVYHTRGGARLSEQLNPNTRLGSQTQAALRNEQWDYVVLQEMSHGPITAPKSFFASVEQLCRQIRANGAVPILFATWAYQRGGAKLTGKGWDYDEMAQTPPQKVEDRRRYFAGGPDSAGGRLFLVRVRLLPSGGRGPGGTGQRRASGGSG